MCNWSFLHLTIRNTKNELEIIIKPFLNVNSCYFKITTIYMLLSTVRTKCAQLQQKTKFVFVESHSIKYNVGETSSVEV